MRGIAMTPALMLTLAACSGPSDGDGARTTQTGAAKPETVMNSSKNGSDGGSGGVAPVDAAGGCRPALAALVAGRLTEFGGLTGCTAADAEAAFGAAQRPGHHRATGIAVNGVDVVADGDRLVRVVLPRPTLDTPPTELLGQPESAMGSKLGGATKQWIYASRGLTLHYREMEKRYIAVVAYPPMTVEEYLASPLSRMEQGPRDPIKDR